MEEKYKRGMEKRMYRRKVLESLLVVATIEDGLGLPTINEFILSEVVNGTIDFVGGNAGQINYQQFRFERESFERKLIEYFEEEMGNSRGKVNPKIRDAIQEMVKYHWVYVPDPGDNYPTCGLYQDFKDFCGTGICPISMQSTFSLPYDLVKRVSEKVIPSFSNAERKSVEGIGDGMRRFIEEDLEYIKEHYYW